jgi:hypothetical protein
MVEPAPQTVSTPQINGTSVKPALQQPVPQTGPTIGVDQQGTLIGAKREQFSDHADIDADPCDAVFGNLVELLENFEGDEELKRQTQNIIKLCGTCNKPNGRTLSNCNACGSFLPKNTSTSQNVFVSFIYGVKPFTISIRHQSSDFLVFDDLMSCTPCHFNAISTKYYIQDWRFLLKKPREGLDLVDALYARASDVLWEQYYSNKPWRQKIIHPDAQVLTIKQLCEEHVCAGMNYPPSQFQLHLQYMLPPLVPHQMQMYEEGSVFTYGRFFPVKYIRTVLQQAAAGQNFPDEVDGNTSIDEIIQHFDGLGVSYKQIHTDFMAGVGNSQRALSNWRSDDFTLRLRDGKVFDSKTNEPVEQFFQDVLKADKDVIQNYGRPYKENGKPGGVFYKHARSERLEEW